MVKIISSLYFRISMLVRRQTFVLKGRSRNFSRTITVPNGIATLFFKAFSLASLGLTFHSYSVIRFVIGITYLSHSRRTVFSLGSACSCKLYGILGSVTGSVSDSEGPYGAGKMVSWAATSSSSSSTTLLHRWHRLFGRPTGAAVRLTIYEIPDRLLKRI